MQKTSSTPAPQHSSTPLTSNLCNRFHPDEALYASYGRLISTGDWNLASRLLSLGPIGVFGSSIA